MRKAYVNGTDMIKENAFFLCSTYKKQTFVS